MLPIGGAEILARPASEVSDDLDKNGAANAQRAFVVGGERVGGEESGCKSGVRERKRYQVIADETELLEFFRGGSNGIGELDEGAHERGARM